LEDQDEDQEMAMEKSAIEHIWKYHWNIL
jgi:hypothetical protein